MAIVPSPIEWPETEGGRHEKQSLLRSTFAGKRAFLWRQRPKPQFSTSSKEYENYLAIYSAKDPAKKAASAEKFLIEHKDADPVVLTQVYKIMFLLYANDSNWRKVIETYDRMSLAPKLTDVDKEKFTKIVELARARLAPSQNTK